MIDFEFILKIEHFFTDLRELSDINVLSKQLNKYFQDLENELALNENRKPATIQIEVINDDLSPEEPYYELLNNEIHLQYNRYTNPAEFFISYYHESIHSGQTYSFDILKEQQELYEISQMLYVSSAQKGETSALYYCNYKEVEAKLAEIQLLIKIYNSAHINNTTLSIHDGNLLYNLFKSRLNELERLTYKNLNKLFISNIIRISKNDFSDSVFNYSKKEMLKFLITKSPKFYSQLQKEINTLKKDFFNIYENLKTSYKDDFSVTDLNLKTLKEKEQLERKEKLNDILYVSKFKEFLTNDEIDTIKKINSFDKLKEEVNNIQKDENILSFSVIDILEQDEYTIYIHTVFPSDIANDILSKNESVNITTEIDENQKEL